MNLNIAVRILLTISESQEIANKISMATSERLDIAVKYSVALSEDWERANNISIAIFEASEIAVNISLVISQHIYQQKYDSRSSLINIIHLNFHSYYYSQQIFLALLYYQPQVAFQTLFPQVLEQFTALLHLLQNDTIPC